MNIGKLASVVSVAVVAFGVIASFHRMDLAGDREQDRLDSLEILAAVLTESYEKECNAGKPVSSFIHNERQKKLTRFFGLAGREYKPPPCEQNSEN